MTITKFNHKARWLAAGAAALLLAACGGGGAPSSNTEQAATKGGNGAARQQVPAFAADESALAKAGFENAEGQRSAAARGAKGLFIVQMAERPAAVYDGDIAGLASTKPQSGKKLDPNSQAYLAYIDFLTRKHDAALAASGGRKAYTYTNVFNGFAAELTDAQAAKLAQTTGVIAIVRSEAQRLDTSSTPEFLGLSGTAGFWNRTGALGENVIIGVVDGGIWPEHPSFSDRTDVNGNGTKDGKLGYQQIPGWNGKCQPGEAFAGTHCNQKLIGARYYNAGYGGDAGVDAQFPWEFNSPRDFGGHGSHTASTAGGNANVVVTGDPAPLGRMSGIAPRARIAAYKACWETGAGGLCQTVDTLAAIDQAVADGVDVINYSIGGSRTSFRDPIAIAFLNAADAGVFVAASAGNSGPTSSSVAHPGPWMTTVANGTHPREGRGSLTLGNGASYQGQSVTSTGVGPAPMILASDAGLAGANPTLVNLCYAAVDNGGVAVLDPAKIAGKVVVCDRGVTARVNKSLAVKEAGGAGMILTNVVPGTLNADFHSLPSIHVADTARAAIRAYAATSGATATIGVGVIGNTAAAPFTNSSSSRGPLLAGGGDLLKPDLIAPGTDVLAAVAPPGNGGQSFALYTGTSMASPHVAGLAALFKEAKPGWSPMAIKSALMTSASDILDGPNTNPLVIFRQGAGHVQPNRALDPGLVFDSGFADWLGFLCGTQLPTSFCTSAGVAVIDPSNMNVASIAIGDLAGAQTVRRRVTNVGASSETYTASYTGLAGYAVSLPASFTVGRGETKSIEIGFLRTAATFNSYAGGQLTLTGDKGHVVRVPMVVRPVALSAPTQVSGSYTVNFGFDGPFTATARGLVAAETSSGSVGDDPTDGACTLNTPNATKLTVNVPAGTTYARFSLFDADSPGVDIDLCVFNAAGTQVGGSGSGTSAEEVNLLNPAAGTYTVVVHGYDVGAGSPFKLHTWLLGSAAAGNMTVNAPAAATTGATGAITLGFSGLVSGTRYLGSVAYGGAAGLPNPTIVRVDP